MRAHQYIPTQVEVMDAGDGARLLVCSWADTPMEQVVIVLGPQVAEEVGKLLTAPSLLPVSKLPPGLEGKI